MKLIGCVVVICSGFGIGMQFANSIKQRLIELKELQVALSILKSEIRFKSQTIPQAFDSVSKVINSNLQNIFIRVLPKLQSWDSNSCTYADLWDRTIKDEIENLYLNKDEICILRDIKTIFNCYDVEHQTNIINMISERVEAAIKNAEEEYRKNSKLYVTFGLFGGILITIFLI